MNRCEKALEFHKNGCNCAQAVACVFADKTAKSSGMKVRGVFDESSEDYVDDIKNICDY